MAKTNRQLPTFRIKKQEKKPKTQIKPTTPRIIRKIAKKITPESENNNSLSVSESNISISLPVSARKNKKSSPASNVEEGSDGKAALPKKSKNGSQITQEQITNLISYVVNDKMSINAASRKVNICYPSGYKYYNMYKNDPERKIPEPFKQTVKISKPITQEQINTLIEYIEEKKMSVRAASRKLNVSSPTGYKYYKLYMDDPEKKIPEPLNGNTSGKSTCTKEQIDVLISSIVEDKMSLSAAARKVNISTETAKRYYEMYMEDAEQKIPEPLRGNTNGKKTCSKQEIEALIGYIENDKMSVPAASKKANIGKKAAYKYYKMYLEDPERNIPEPWTQSVDSYRRCTQEQINFLIDFIVNSKMSVKAASKKVNMGDASAYKYYQLYLEDPERKIPKPKTETMKYGKSCTQDQITSLIGFIVKDKLSLRAASRKVNMNEMTARRYYAKYLEDPNHNIPALVRRGAKSTKHYPQDQIEELIDYIVNDEMSINAASIKAKVPLNIAWKYYNQYLDDPISQDTLDMDQSMDDVDQSMDDPLSQDEMDADQSTDDTISEDTGDVNHSIDDPIPEDVVNEDQSIKKKLLFC